MFAKIFHDAACSKLLSAVVFICLLGTTGISPVQAETTKKNPKPAAGAKAKPSATKPGSAASAEKPESSKDDSSGGNALKQVFQETPTSAGGPLFIKSDTLELNSKDRVFTYKGNVEVVREDVTITADLVEGQYDDKNQLQTIVCKQNVVITKGESMRSTANRAVYHVASATIELTEGPELYRDGNALAADKVTMFINEDRSEAEGNVRMKVIKSEEAGR